MTKSRKRSKNPQQPKPDPGKSAEPLASGMTDAERSALAERVETHQMRDDDIFTLPAEAGRVRAKVELANAQMTHNLDGPYECPEDREESAKATAGVIRPLLNKVLVQGMAHSRRHGKGGFGRWHNDSDTQEKFAKRYEAKQRIEIECRASGKPISSQHELARRIAADTHEKPDTVRKWLQRGASGGRTTKR